MWEEILSEEECIGGSPQLSLEPEWSNLQQEDQSQGNSSLT